MLTPALNRTPHAATRLSRATPQPQPSALEGPDPRALPPIRDEVSPSERVPVSDWSILTGPYLIVLIKGDSLY